MKKKCHSKLQWKKLVLLFLLLIVRDVAAQGQGRVRGRRLQVEDGEAGGLYVSFRGMMDKINREDYNNPPEQQPEAEQVTDSEATQPHNATHNNTTTSSNTCNANGFSRFPYGGKDNAERMLLREGVISSMPKSRCGNAGRKNVILVIGDGLGWSMAQAGAVARQVLDELESLGCNTTVGCPDNQAAKDVFQGRTLSDYYTEGKGSGLSFQNLTGYTHVTNSAVILQEPSPGNHGAPANSLLEGAITDHDNGMAPLALDECGNPIEFSPLDYATQGGNMVLWDEIRGGKYPWDSRYAQEDLETLNGFDPTYIMQHATDSAATATAMATGHKVANGMVSVDLYEEEITTILEEAMTCGMSGGVVTSMPVLHATPAAFITHSNSRSNQEQLRRSFQQVNPTFTSGVCSGNLYPFPEYLDSMRSGVLRSSWALFEQQPNVMAEQFYSGIDALDPDRGHHVLACMGGKYTPSRQTNLPYRGVDSNYANRRCGRGSVQRYRPDPNATTTTSTIPGTPIGVTPNNSTCNHYSQEEIRQIPHISQNVKAALDFLGKDDDGFFLMYEQGDIDTAAHSNHMDDMLGTLLDLDDSVAVIIDWIAQHGGWEKNALYVTADHDHYLTLLPQFPQMLANKISAGESHNITPERFSDINPWQIAIEAGRHIITKDTNATTLDNNKTQVDHIRDFTTWTEQDIDNVGHFWGAAGGGGNAWGSHSTRPVPLYYMGDDDGCIEKLLGKGYQVLGRHVNGVPDKIDQVHLHACMMKNLFGL